LHLAPVVILSAAKNPGSFSTTADARQPRRMRGACVAESGILRFALNDTRRGQTINLLTFQPLSSILPFVQFTEQIVQSKVTPISMKGTKAGGMVMLSTLYHDYFAPADDVRATRNLRARLGDQLDEIAVFALVAVAVFYIAAASCWFIM
jgi:hypothetical protein